MRIFLLSCLLLCFASTPFQAVRPVSAPTETVHREAHPDHPTDKQVRKKHKKTRRRTARKRPSDRRADALDIVILIGGLLFGIGAIMVILGGGALLLSIFSFGMSGSVGVGSTYFLLTRLFIIIGGSLSLGGLILRLFTRRGMAMEYTQEGNTPTSSSGLKLSPYAAKAYYNYRNQSPRRRQRIERSSRVRGAFERRKLNLQEKNQKLDFRQLWSRALWLIVPVTLVFSGALIALLGSITAGSTGLIVLSVVGFAVAVIGVMILTSYLTDLVILREDGFLR